MRSLLAACLMVFWMGCSPDNRGGDDTTTPDADDPGPCVGLQCQVVKCEKMGLPPTTISGTVFAPNGTLALPRVTVYVPNIMPPKFPDGAQCDRCEPTAALPGEPVTQAMSDTTGRFTLTNAPSGSAIPLLVTIGKWRRIALIDNVVPCQDNVVGPDITSLPKHKGEGEMPKIAIATGSCDALECLLKKIGISEYEFSNDTTGTGNVHMFSSNGATSHVNGQTFSPASTLWQSADKMKQYDIAMFSCECSQAAAGKPQPYMDAVKAYADFGGRVFLSHYHNVWIAGERGVPTHAPAVWPTIATCATDSSSSGNDIIDQVNNPKGETFAQWMLAVMGSTTLGVIPIQDGRQTCNSIDNTKAERWVYFPSGGTDYPQVFQFTTPNEVAKEERCGKVVFSDMHVASGSSSSSPFPMGCSTAPMTPQEKALAFMFFDINTCVGDIF